MTQEHLHRVYTRASETAGRVQRKIESAHRGLIGRAIAKMATEHGLCDGPEREFFDGEARKASMTEVTRLGRANEVQAHFSFPTPGDPHRVFLSWDAAARAMSTTSGPRGGFAVGIDLLDPVDILRPFSITGNLPVQTIQLGGQGSIPLTNSGVNVTWQGGDGVQVVAADPALGSGSLVPRTAIALTQFSRQLEAQSPNYYDFLARLLMRGAGTALDRALLNGAGGAEPLGLLNLPSLAKVTGASLPWSGANSILRMRRTVGDASADNSSVAWIGTPTVRETLGAREVVATSGRFVWDSGQIDGRPAFVTTDLPAGTLLLGDFSRVIVGFWAGGVAIEVDPHNDYNKGLSAMRVVMICDACPLNTATFVAATGVS